MDEPDHRARADIIHLDQRTPKEPSVDKSEFALGEMFAEQFQHKFRYVGQWAKWFVFNGRNWEMDYKQVTHHTAKFMLKRLANDWYKLLMKHEDDEIKKQGLGEIDAAKKRKVAKARLVHTVGFLKTNRMLINTVAIARIEKSITLGIDEWDADPWLLNTPTGVVDLRTGSVRDARPKDYMTMIAGAGPSNMSTPLWTEFIKQITDGDKSLAEYMQRVLGYCLTGHTGEHAMFFGFGTGANGKSVMLNTIGKLMGDYHKSTAMETFILSSDYRHPTELAGLRGARIVTASETQKGRKWDEVKVKRLTGGDPITARFMRQDFFEFYPQFKLFIVGNNKPSLNTVDEAMRRRFNLIPFTVTIPEHKRDPNLSDKLKTEWPGIMSWMLEGCLEFQKSGLIKPSAVKEATETYMSMEDGFTAWWGECIDIDPNAFCRVSDAYDSWKKWTSKSGDIPGGSKEFSQTLLARADILKIKYYRSSEGRGFRGMKIRAMPTK